MKAVTKITLVSEDGEKFFGEGPARLLRGVEEKGSLRAASMAMEMAYTKALQIIKRAEEVLGFPLMIRTTGGKTGGGSILTNEGRAWLKQYESYRDACIQASQKLYVDFFQEQSKRPLIIVRGGGDLATGTIYKLKKSGFSVLILEIQNPSAIRRNVAFSEAVYQKTQTVEDMTCYYADSLEQAQAFLNEGKLTLMIDSAGDAIQKLQPMAVVDAIIAKRNLGTSKTMAPITVALGPGFIAGEDVDAVVETKRGHNLGRVIWKGSAAPNTGIPGVIGGYGKERVIHASAKGILKNVRKITDTVHKGEVIALIETENGSVPVEATLDGILRGLIRDGYPVIPGFKIADIDPRAEEYDNCFTISDKARCIAGGVLEAILQLKKERNL